MYLIKKITESLLLKKKCIKHFHFSVVISLRPLPRQSFPSQPKQIDRLGTNHFHSHHLGFSAKKKKKLFRV